MRDFTQWTLPDLKWALLSGTPGAADEFRRRGLTLEGVYPRYSITFDMVDLPPTTPQQMEEMRAAVMRVIAPGHPDAVWPKPKLVPTACQSLHPQWLHQRWGRARCDDNYTTPEWLAVPGGGGYVWD